MAKSETLLVMQAQAIELVQGLWRGAEWRYHAACFRSPELRGSRELGWQEIRETVRKLDPELAADLTSWHAIMPGYCRLDGYKLEVLLRVAELGTRKEFLASTNHVGFCLALISAGESLHSRLPQQSRPEPPDFCSPTTPAQRRTGLKPSEYDIYRRDVVLELLRWNLPVPPGLEASMPAPDEVDFADFILKMAAAIDERSTWFSDLSRQSADARREDNLTSLILQDWVPRALWRLSTNAALKALGKPGSPHFVKAYDQSVRALNLARSRDKSAVKKIQGLRNPFVRPPSANGM